jgi:hypothetical protein
MRVPLIEDDCIIGAELWRALQEAWRPDSGTVFAG